MDPTLMSFVINAREWNRNTSHPAKSKKVQASTNSSKHDATILKDQSLRIIMNRACLATKNIFLWRHTKACEMLEQVLKKVTTLQYYIVVSYVLC
jgi:hypothetical protein